jgi:predicted MFS family arabinose efflux permease
LVPFSVFRSRPLTAANGVGVAINAALIGTFFFLTLYLQGPGGYSPLRAGFAFLPIGLSTFTGSLTSTRLVRHLGVRSTILLGTAIGTIGLIWLATALDAHVAYGTHLLGPLILFGLGAGAALVPLTIAATHDVPAHQAGLASGLINTSRQMGGAIGLAVMSAVATHAQHTTTAGYRLAFLVAAAFLFAGLLSGAAIGRAGPPRG